MIVCDVVPQLAYMVKVGTSAGISADFFAKTTTRLYGEGWNQCLVLATNNP
ncbi:hypothetical protein TWF730_011361 [Orbilia blumenaviensis]|uniref:Uncharacterized protein n=1 Tax=Orbilia blumenaviensis TaxID=1796055 RepID=A0AAV9UKY5_9PEZI